MEDWDGRFELVHPGKIVVDHRYQRDERQGLIQVIAANPNWAAFGVVACIERPNGILYAIDGQQRLAGVKASDHPPMRVPTVIFKVDSAEDEARIFNIINESRKNLYPLEKHKSRVFWKEEAATAVERAIETAGFTLGAKNSSSRTVQAVTALNAIYNNIGEEGLTQTLICVRDAWPEDKSSTESPILYAVSQVIADQAESYNRQKVVGALSKTTPGLVLRKASEFTLELGGAKKVNVRRAIKALCKV